MDELKNHPEVAENWGVFDSAFQKLQKGYDQLEQAFIALQLLEPDPAYETQAVNAFNDIEEAITEYSKASKKRKEDGVGAAVGAAGGGGASKTMAKSVDALKPDVGGGTVHADPPSPQQKSGISDNAAERRPVDVRTHYLPHQGWTGGRCGHHGA